MFGLDAVTVVIVLEFILAVYSIALAMNAKGKVLKLVHFLLAAVWVVLAILNILGV